MSEQIFNTRIVHKHDTEANWNKAANFSPKQGELIVYDIDENYNYERFKIGDGSSNVNDLPFISERFYKQNEEPIDAEEGAIWIDLDEASDDAGIKIELDTTLTQEGMAADSKAVGDAIDNLLSQIDNAGSIDIDLDGSNEGEVTPVNADTLGGKLASEYATENFVMSKIAEAQLDGSGDVDLSGYATKDYVDDNMLNKSSIVNNFTTTEEGFVADARALKELNEKFIPVLLWENAVPTNTLKAQSIPIDVSGYAGIRVRFMLNINSDSNYIWHYIPMGYTSICPGYYYPSDGLTIVYRNISVGKTYVHVGKDMGRIIKSVESQTLINDIGEYMIPLEIYGVK